MTYIVLSGTLNYTQSINQPPAEGFSWDDLREIFCGCQRMTKVPNAVEILPKISTA